jgi:CRISPR-associated endonuclease Cas1
MAVAIKHQAPIEEITLQKGVLVLTGFGVNVSVERGALIVEDGIGTHRRRGQFYRATSEIERLVIIGHSGTVSLDALRWLNDVGAAFVQLDSDGKVIIASTSRELNDARLRRSQALAATTTVGLNIVQDLLRAKLEAQRDVLKQFESTEEQQTEIENRIEALASCTDPRALMVAEAQAAASYWNGWRAVQIRFARRDQARIPEHWKSFETRRSPISGSSRLSGTPINSMLNYLYGILETEVRLAILTIGLDPGMALLHSDLKSRDSFVFDVIEPLRPLMDGYLLELLSKRLFQISDFHETRQGVIRIMPDLVTVFAEFGPETAKLVRPVVEQVALRLAESNSRPFIIPTLLTQSNRSSGRDLIRQQPKRENKPEPISKRKACIECGTILADADRHYCDDCLPEHMDKQAEVFSTSGRARLQELRSQGNDPSTGPEANAKRRAIMTQRRKDEIEWNALNPDQTVDEEWFKTTVIPVLQSMSLSQISGETGLSQQYCSLIKRGLKIPHPRHKEAFQNMLSKKL